MDQETESALYEVRKKIYPRSVQGLFHYWRVALVWVTQIVFYGLPWLTWGDRPAVLFDLGTRKFYIFGLVFWPQDFILLAILLVIAALSLFLFTAVGGRLWCGYACPQTVYTEIYLWVEKWIEGDRQKRMKLDQSPWGPRKLAIKGAKQAAWIGIGLWTGFTFVGYFTPIRELWHEVITLSTGPWETFWVLFYGFATYGNAGYLREQVCKYMCPYARFQGVMFDPDTLIVTYDNERGEPRGARNKKADRKALGVGDCVDCGICVQVCPTGIDIRKGLQYECIGCGLCIDGCNQVMDKMGYPRGLIRYSTENVMEHRYTETSILAHVFRPRVLIYTGILATVVAAMLATIWLRSPIKMNVLRDRVSIAREAEDGRIENLYRLQLINTREEPVRLVLRASGVEGVEVRTEVPQPIEVGAAGSRTVTTSLLVDPAVAKPGSYKVTFELFPENQPDQAISEKSTFLVK
ncbi:MAG TPA: cytochrome c oxidase accessory protein CcoG [Burkholderiales bacterium]|nr:cytochrome c oxidase accessory protein CcoG [Burkholderiales bacterium]